MSDPYSEIVFTHWKLMSDVKGQSLNFISEKYFKKYITGFPTIK